MAEFAEVMKKSKEMCDYYEICSDGCPLKNLKYKHNDLECFLYMKNYPKEAEAAIMAWEKPVTVDWSKVEVDTKILVRNGEIDNWEKRYFAKFENGAVYAWADGKTSFTARNDEYVFPWNYAKLAEETDE